MVINTSSGTRVDEIADRVYRISTPVPPSVAPGGFSFNQYLLLDEQPLLFHTGPRATFALTVSAIESVLPVSSVRYFAFSHFENDECGALGQLLAAAPGAEPVCSRVNRLINGGAFDRPARALADGEQLSLGSRSVEWLDTPHLPHAWECGSLHDPGTHTLLCGDLFTQPGADNAPITTGDILGPAEALREQLDYWAHAPGTAGMLERLARLEPTTLACMHGSAFTGDCASLLREYALVLTGAREPARRPTPEQVGEGAPPAWRP